MKKKALFWLFYFLVQLPVAILCIKGFRLNSIIGDRKRSFVYDCSIEDGKYSLYDYTTSEEFGFITIRNQLDDGDLIVSISSKSVSGRDDMFNEDYNFLNLNIIDFRLEKKEYKGEFYWMGQHEDINLITHVTQKRHYPPC